MRLRYVTQGCSKNEPCDLRGYLEQQQSGAVLDYTVWPLEYYRGKNIWVTWVSERFSGTGHRKRMRVCTAHQFAMEQNYQDIARIEVLTREATDNYHTRQGYMLR